ncbi:hypothetical protein AG1IA_09817 [Rhizoctonia solani AG-1 IA]|uniref:Uncharacterized protein n=1 Tax=Thanatephorus cucumeris (strain AG1-IA) TaxID=983506 RepID=L8WH90_THACA|nr:hypothetical protein AG1IA_09817 [Rhizoctonia solani AG-1 IA]
MVLECSNARLGRGADWLRRSAPHDPRPWSVSSYVTQPQTPPQPSAELPNLTAHHHLTTGPNIQHKPRCRPHRQ